MYSTAKSNPPSVCKTAHDYLDRMTVTMTTDRELCVLASTIVAAPVSASPGAQGRGRTRAPYVVRIRRFVETDEVRHTGHVKRACHDRGRVLDIHPDALVSSLGQNVHQAAIGEPVQSRTNGSTISVRRLFTMTSKGATVKMTIPGRSVFRCRGESACSDESGCSGS
jgi:hypothetical protein